MRVTDQTMWTLTSEYEVYDNREEAVRRGIVEDAAWSDPDSAAGDYDLFLVRVAQVEVPRPTGENVRFEDLLLAFIKSRDSWSRYGAVRTYSKVGAGWSVQVANELDYLPDDTILVTLTDLLIWLWVRSVR